ncbi:MAG TPA: hypothetical protein VM261_04190 [Kofleriaceae bacterium]|nr:hypothetical protein [Kofleriaceae bacterium]
MKFLLTLSCTFGLAALAGCADTDDSMYLTGTEEHALRTENGQFVCPSPRKVLVCHIPPGNPDNAHTICVGANAVDAHQANHGDPIGACVDGGGDDPPPPPPSDDPPPPPPEEEAPPPVL